MPESSAARPIITLGTAFATIAYDLAQSIDLAACERILAVDPPAPVGPRRREAPYFEYHPAPLRISQPRPELALGRYRTGPDADVVLYDFGAVSVTYRIPLAGPLDGLVRLSDDLYDNPALRSDSRQCVEGLRLRLQGAMNKPVIQDVVEDYVVYQVAAFDRPVVPADLCAAESALLVQILRAETQPPSRDQVADATEARISFGSNDLAVIDWNSALFFGVEVEELRAVIEFANVQLLELRYLDRLLDDTLERAYVVVSRPRWNQRAIMSLYGADLRHVARLQVDSTILFERVTNALKLLGEQYVSRTYRVVSRRFDLDEWNASITRKLATVDHLYQTLSGWASTLRVEALEWIIVLLIGLEIVLSLVRD